MITKPQAPRLLARLLGILEFALLAGAAVLLTVNALHGRDETLWAALAFLVAYVAIRFLPAPKRLPARLLLVVVAVASLMGELVVRWNADALRGRLFTELPDSFVWVKDPALHYTYSPGQPCTDGTRHVTKHRICDRPHGIPKPAGVFRILVLGDSTSLFVEPYDDLWHQRLERALAAETGLGAPVEVVNGAVEGYNSAQQVAFLEKYLLDFGPDLVIVGYCVNDPYPGVAGWRKARSRLLRLASLLVASWTSGVEPQEEFGWLHENPETWGRVVTAYERLHDIAVERGFPVVGFVMPEMSGQACLKDVYAKVEALFRQTGLHVLDVHSDLTRADEEGYRTGRDTLHPNGAFHARLAERMRAFLFEERLLPMAPDASLSHGPEQRPESGHGGG